MRPSFTLNQFHTKHITLSNEKVDTLANAAKYDRKYEDAYQSTRKQLGHGYLEQAIAFAKKAGNETSVNKYKALAKKYLGDTLVEQELPEVKIYQKGSYTLSLKSNEQTPYWIMFEGHNFNVSSADYNYNLIFDDGQIIKDGPTVKYPTKMRAKFRLQAITDQPEIKIQITD